MVNQPRQLGKVVGHQGDIGGFDGSITSGGSHRDTQSCSAQCGCIIYTISNHCNLIVFFYERFDGCNLIRWQKLGVNFVNSCLDCDGVGGSLVVACSLSYPSA